MATRNTWEPLFKLNLHKSPPLWTLWLIGSVFLYFLTKPVTATLLSLQDRGQVKAAPSGWHSFLWETPKPAAFLTKPVSGRASAEDAPGEWGGAAEDLCSWKWTRCSPRSDCQNCDPARTADSYRRSVSPTLVLPANWEWEACRCNVRIYWQITAVTGSQPSASSSPGPIKPKWFVFEQSWCYQRG